MRASEAVPYYLQSGDGLRFERDNQLWTVIALASDTGAAFDAASILGGQGAQEPFHSLADPQRSYVVFDGMVQFWLPRESRILTSGDSIHVPPGVPVAYRMLAHMSRILFFSAPGGPLDALSSGEGTERTVYSVGTLTGIGGPLLRTGTAQLHDLSHAEVRDVWDEELPAGVQGYFHRAHTGDTRAWPDAVNSYNARGRNTGRRYFSVTTVGARQPYIHRHFHRLHTENFFCLSGRVCQLRQIEQVRAAVGLGPNCSRPLVIGATRTSRGCPQSWMKSATAGVTLYATVGFGRWLGSRRSKHGAGRPRGGGCRIARVVRRSTVTRWRGRDGRIPERRYRTGRDGSPDCRRQFRCGERRRVHRSGKQGR